MTQNNKIDAIDGPSFQPVNKVAFNDGGLLYKKKEQTEQAAVVASAMPPIDFSQAGLPRQIHNPSGGIFGYT